ncbi:hypothetical protein CTI12_AA491180 [Artemisia annua]|uniref:Uncharacterized protein n=1 Tax=Artemisia annua TaxID=35608 RepID=A0A2U1LBS7_ARTAN|nr:hypothetical protein CTI12_AA491180 [Artemisia annua]
MAPRFPKCLKIAQQIGDRRIHRVLHTIFRREKEAYKGDEKSYNERIEEIQARVEHRHGIILELKKFEDPLLDESLADLKVEEKEDLAEIGHLIQMSYFASLRADLFRVPAVPASLSSWKMGFRIVFFIVSFVGLDVCGKLVSSSAGLVAGFLVLTVGRGSSGTVMVSGKLAIA